MKNHLKISNAAARYYIACMKKYPGYLAGWLIAIPLTTLVNNYLPPLIVAGVIKDLSKNSYPANSLWANFAPEIIWYFALLLLGIFLWRVVDFCMWHLEQNIQQDIAEQVFRHLLSRSLDFHSNNFGGSLVSQTNKLMGGYVRVQDSTIYQAYGMFCGIIIAIFILGSKSLFIGLGLLIFVLLYLLVAILLAKPIHHHLTRFASAESKQTGMLADAITNVTVIKSFARQKYEKQRFHGATENTKQHLRRFAYVQQFQMMGLGSMGRIIAGFALVSAIISVTNFHADVATVFLIVSYTSVIVDQLFQFSNNTLRNYNRAFGEAKEMANILLQEPEIADPIQPEKLAMEQGLITFDNVTFTHNGSNGALFQNFDLTIAPGEKIGLVGHSGSGKTTFTRLLLRFSDIQDGQILIDGQNIAHVTQEDLHQAIAYVPQEPLLFHRSIRENIAYGKHNATDADIALAAKSAHAAEFITDLPQKYDTLVGERGVKLSGGQRQRIAIARAMLKNAPILILDEATSALDSESEVLIQDALWKLMDGRTAIVIAHRLSTIQKMDRILVLDGGRVVEQGSHKTLLGQNGVYAKLWAHQSGGFIED